MKKGFGRGFFSGVFTAALIMALSVTALAAAGRTISVEGGIKVILNGAAFTPKDSKGNDVELFVYNGTTYAPIRAICEAAGMTVSYDAASRTARITTPTASGGTGGSASSGRITAERAKEIALEHAGLSAEDVVFVNAKLGWDDGRAEFEVEFYSGNTEYDYDIDAVTGEIISYDQDIDGYAIPSQPPAADYISEARAKEIALADAPAGAIVVKCKLDRDDGRMVYEVELRSGAVEYEYEIDAVTGSILSREMD